MKINSRSAAQKFRHSCFTLEVSLPHSHRHNISSSMDPYKIGTITTKHLPKINFNYNPPFISSSLHSFFQVCKLKFLCISPLRLYRLIRLHKLITSILVHVLQYFDCDILYCKVKFNLFN